MTAGWLDITAEYRAFTIGSEVLTCSPYLVGDEMWSPELAGSRRSHTAGAAGWLGTELARLGPGGVPPAAALDVAELADGRFVLLEANQALPAGLYSCGEDDVLRALVAAHDGAGAGSAWLFEPDPTLPLH